MDGNQDTVGSAGRTEQTRDAATSTAVNLS